MVVVFPEDGERDPQRRDAPVIPEKPRAVESPVLSQQVVVRDPDRAVVAKFVVEPLQPLGGPPLRPVASGALPFAPSPGILEQHEAFPLRLDVAHHGVCV